METYLYLLAAKRNDKGVINEIRFVDLHEGTGCSSFTDTPESTAINKLCKKLNSLKPFQGSSSPFQCDFELKFIGFGALETIRKVWLRSIAPDDNGAYLDILPLWVCNPSHSFDPVQEINGNDSRVVTFNWFEFLQSRGFKAIPKNWAGPGNDLDFDIAALTALCLQLRVIDERIKGAS